MKQKIIKLFFYPMLNVFDVIWTILTLFLFYLVFAMTDSVLLSVVASMIYLVIGAYISHTNEKTVV